jgi:hypothetical protein
LKFLKNIFTILFLLLVFPKVTFSQTPEEIIKKNAIECKDLTAVNENLYSVLKNFKCICIGEMHGTKEPAEFLVGLAKTFSQHAKKLIIGFEIPNWSMNEFNAKHDTSQLSKTGFFSKKSSDGRASKAWYHAIDECTKLNVTFCFFDNINDKEMFNDLISCYKTDTNAVIITISGNVHNKLVPYKDEKTMGAYLKEYFGSQVFSINHMYNEGTMYNKSSEEVKLHTIAPTNNILSTSTPYSKYFILNIFENFGLGYSGFIYTRAVTASFPLTK